MSIQICEDGITSSTGNLTIEGTGSLKMPTGTTAQRPSSPEIGYTRYNTDNGSIEFYDGTNWISTNLIPEISSVSGTIYKDQSGSITLGIENSTDAVDVKWYENTSLLATSESVTVTNGSATVSVPAAVYGQSNGDTITIQVFNSDGTPSSNTVTRTVVALPTGGNISSSGGYRYHTFNGSGTFVNNLAGLSINYMLVAGGGCGGGNNAGGGGAGGMIVSNATLNTGNYGITIGGGSPQQAIRDPASATRGYNSTFNGQTAIGGGCGAGDDYNGQSGGSGGGASDNNNSGGAGTSGQGNRGGNAADDNSGGGGGGGRGEHGGDITSNNYGNTSAHYGGDGYQWLNGTYYAGGGGGSLKGSGATTPGGNGGGGNGGAANFGTANRGGGGGGTPSGSGGGGGSGICIIRYAE